MKYITSQVEIKNTQTGKTYKKAVLNDGTQVSVWPDYSQYDKVVEGGDVEGVIKTNGKYSNLVDGNLGAKPAGMRANVINQAMAKKSEAIEHFAEKKDLGIRLSSSIRMSVDIVTAFYKDLDEAEIKTKILNWREWFLDNWETTQATKDDFSGTPF